MQNTGLSPIPTSVPHTHARTAGARAVGALYAECTAAGAGRSDCCSPSLPEPASSTSSTADNLPDPACVPSRACAGPCFPASSPPRSRSGHG
eukprot:3757532-Rhodomonas_salina.1